MPAGTARQAVIDQISYALAVQTLVEQEAVQNPEQLITPRHKETTDQAAERVLEEFERHSLVDEVRQLTDRHGFFYGVFQGVVAALFYSIILVIIALIIKYNGIDIINALTPPPLKS